MAQDAARSVGGVVASQTALATGEAELVERVTRVEAGLETVAERSTRTESRLDDWDARE